MYVVCVVHAPVCYLCFMCKCVGVMCVACYLHAVCMCVWCVHVLQVACVLRTSVCVMCVCMLPVWWVLHCVGCTCASEQHLTCLTTPEHASCEQT